MTRPHNADYVNTGVAYATSLLRSRHHRQVKLASKLFWPANLLNSVLPLISLDLFLLLVFLLYV